MSSKPFIYVDSCCFVEAVRVRRGLPFSTSDQAEIEQRKNDAWFFRKLCDASVNGDIQLITSMLSIAECLHAGEPDGPSQETRELFIEFLTSGTVVDLIEPDLFVSERARDLLWNDKILLSGADGLHLASAFISQCKEFITLDGKIKNKTKFSAAIPGLRALGLRVIRPSETLYLPDEFRRDDMFQDIENAPSAKGDED